MKTFQQVYLGEKGFAKFVSENQIGTHETILVQVFSGVIDADILRDVVSVIVRHIPNAVIIGTTTDGEIISGEAKTGSIVIACSTFEKTKLRSMVCKHIGDDSFTTGSELAKSIVRKDTKLLIVFGDGLHTNGEELLKGIHSVDTDIVVSGGLAGDYGVFKETYVLDNTGIHTNCVVAVAFDNEELLVSTEYVFDWMTVGIKMTVTKSEKNRVYSIDSIPTKQVYDKYFGKDIADKLPATGAEFPLVVKRNGMEIARVATQVHEDGSISFAGNIETGDKVQFGIGNTELILDSSMGMREKFRGRPVESIFIYSCMARRRFLGDSIIHDLSPVQSVCDTVGFFTYGEFFHAGNCNEFLNESMTVLTLSEGTDSKSQFSKMSDKKSDQSNMIQALVHLTEVTSSELETRNAELKNEMEEYRILEVEKEHLKDINAMKDGFINMASHELRTPLTAINGYLTMALDGDFGAMSDEMNHAVTVSQRSTKRLIGIVNDMLDQAKLDSGKMVLIDEVFSVRDILSEIYDEYQHVFLKHTLVLDCEIDSLVSVQTDSGRFRQVMVNLLGNAMKFTPESGVITVRAKKHDQHIRVEVSDTGIGIEEGNYEKLFAKFGQIGGAYSDKHQGTGLGLPISKDIVELMGGNLEFESTVGKGTNFYFSLPIHQSPSLNGANFLVNKTK